MARYVVLSEVALGEREWERLGCSEFDAAGYAITAADLRGALGLSDRVGEDFRPMKGAIKVANLEELEKLISGISKDDIVLVFSELSAQTRPLFRLLRRYDVRYSAVDLGVLPLDRLRSAKAAVSMIEYLSLRWEDIRSVPYRWWKFLRQVAGNRFDYFQLQSPWLWLTAGMATNPMRSNLPSAWRARRVPVVSFDCLTVANLQEKPAAARSIAVFVDEAFCDHPDFDIVGRKSPVTAGKYWVSLDRLFRAVEAKYGVTVIVAPHPKSGTIFDPTIVARVQAGVTTAELIRDCDFVLCHASTAVSFAVLFRKPLIFVTTDEIENSIYRGAIARMSSCFSLLRVNADRFDDASLTVPPVDEQRYRSYERLFLRAPGAAKVSPWKVLRAEAEAAARATA